MVEEGWFENSSEMKLYERRMKPETPPLAHMVIIHGYGDHCSRYEWVMHTLATACIASYTYDQRGHGRSPGKRGYIHRFEDLLDDLDVFLRHLNPEATGAPLFIMGHSMGGMVLARYAQTRTLSVNGLVFSSPFLAFSETVPAFLIAIGPIIARFFPWMPVSKVDNEGLSRDSAVIEATNNDPLAYHGRVAAHTAGEFYRMIQAIRQEASKITLPMLILHGGADSIVSPSGSEMLHTAASSKDKTLRIYPDGYHELFNDLEKEEFMAEIITWVKARI